MAMVKSMKNRKKNNKKRFGGTFSVKSTTKIQYYLSLSKFRTKRYFEINRNKNEIIRLYHNKLLNLENNENLNDEEEKPKQGTMLRWNGHKIFVKPDVLMREVDGNEKITEHCLEEKFGGMMMMYFSERVDDDTYNIFLENCDIELFGDNLDRTTLAYEAMWLHSHGIINADITSHNSFLLNDMKNGEVDTIQVIGDFGVLNLNITPKNCFKNILDLYKSKDTFPSEIYVNLDKKTNEPCVRENNPNCVSYLLNDSTYSRLQTVLNTNKSVLRFYKNNIEKTTEINNMIKKIEKNIKEIDELQANDTKQIEIYNLIKNNIYVELRQRGLDVKPLTPIF